MSRKKVYVFVGAKEPDTKVSNPGGQLTASIGLKKYAIDQGFDFYVVDTTQASFPVPHFSKRFIKGLSRLWQVFLLLIRHEVNGIIIFSSSGFSFYERTMISMVGNIFGVKSIFFMRDGHFKIEIANSLFKENVSKILLKIPTVIGIQGDSWRPFFNQLGVAEHKMVTVPNWLPEHVRIAAHPVLLNAECVHFCFVGWLVKEKGVLELLHAINLVQEQNVAFKFTFVGGGTLEEHVKDYVKINNLNQVVNVLGWCTPEKVALILSESHVFILPSHAEGFPNSLLEAMAVGLPAICTDVGAITDSLKHEVNGFVIPTDSAASIAEAMLAYINNPNLVTQHSIQALSIINTLHNKNESCRRIFDAIN